MVLSSLSSDPGGVDSLPPGDGPLRPKLGDDDLVLGELAYKSPGRLGWALAEWGGICFPKSPFRPPESKPER